MLLVFPALVVIGGFLPQAPFVSRFGAFIAEDLPWVIVGAFQSTLLAAFALGFRGGRPAGAVLAASLLTLVGSVAIAADLYAFAGEHGASFSIARQATTPEPAREPDDRTVFATIDGVQLSTAIYRHVESPYGGGDGRTAVVYVHGGAFVAGGLGMRPHLLEFLSEQGYTVLDVEYRLSPPPRWADAPADVLCALAWLRGAATELEVDPSRVFLMGESAGGSLALVAGYAAGSEAITPSCPGEPIVPAGVIAVSPAADLAGIWADGTAETGGMRFPEEYVGGTPTNYPDRYDAASPFRLLRPSLPPTLLIGGANDHLVLPIRVASLYDRFRAAGVHCRLLMVPFAEHGFDGYPNGFGQQLEESIVPAFMREVVPAGS